MLLSPPIRTLFSQREKSLKLNGLWGKDSKSVPSPVSLHPLRTQSGNQLGLRIVYFELTNTHKMWTNTYTVAQTWMCVCNIAVTTKMYIHTAAHIHAYIHRWLTTDSCTHTMGISYPHRQLRLTSWALRSDWKVCRFTHLWQPEMNFRKVSIATEPLTDDSI